MPVLNVANAGNAKRVRPRGGGRNLGRIVLLLGVVALIIGVAFIVQGVAKSNMIAEVMQLEQVT